MDSRTLAEAFDYVRQHQIPIHSLLIVRVLTLGYSRRTFVRVFLAERQEHWLAAMEAAFRDFGGVVVGQNSIAAGRTREVPDRCCRSRL